MDNMKIYRLGKEEAPVVLVQPVEKHSLEKIEAQVKMIRSMTDAEFSMIAAGVEDWNRELSPWEAKPVFGNEGFGGGAQALLDEILPACDDEGRTYYIGGYSLAGLLYSTLHWGRSRPVRQWRTSRCYTLSCRIHTTLPGNNGCRRGRSKRRDPRPFSPVCTAGF